jgi:hypothetical protein
MSYEVTGVVRKVGQTQEINASFSKRELVLRTVRQVKDNSYEDFIVLEFSNAGMSQLDGLKAGQEVTVNFDLSGREYTDKKTGELRYFSSLRGWKVMPGGESAATAPAVASNGDSFYPSDADNDLPF